MKTKRLLIALAAVLLSCGITNAQQTEGNNVNEDKQSDVEVKAVQGDANKDGVVNAADVPVLADSIITDKLSDLERLDLNEDQKVNAADVTLLIKKIQDTNYFWMGTVKPTSTDYSTKEDVITTYEGLEDALKAAPSIKVEEADKSVFILCPSSWNLNLDNVVVQDEADGTIYTLQKDESDIVKFDIYKTEEKTVAASTFVLKKKEDAECPR